MKKAAPGLVGELRETLAGLWSLVVGLGVTGNQFFRRQVTVHYPRQTVDNLSTFRGPLELIPSAKDPSKPDCILCGMCAQNCPSGCIDVQSHFEEEPDADEPKAQAAAEAAAEGEKKAPPKKKKKIKVIDSFTQNFNLCSLCGLCVQNCPGNGLRFSHEAYLAGTSRADFELDLLARMRARYGVSKASANCACEEARANCACEAERR
ncbi:MAG: 4Fe-4S dicluster domain-containing protein [bacterium]